MAVVADDYVSLGDYVLSTVFGFPAMPQEAAGGKRAVEAPAETAPRSVFDRRGLQSLAAE